MSDSVEPLLRALVALGVVLALIWGAARGWRRTAGGRVATSAALEVLARQPVARGAAVALLRVGADRAVLVGVTEQGVSLLGDLPLTEATATPSGGTAAERREELDLTQVAVPAGGTQRPALAGSALSPATWRTAVEVLRERSTRR